MENPRAPGGGKVNIFAALRVKNEARWIERVILSVLPLCQRVFVLDDHSTDGTADICEAIGPQVQVYRSTFEGLDETRDRQFILDRMCESVPCEEIDWLSGREDSPYWALAIDGDEELIPGGQDAIQAFVQKSRDHAAKLRVLYLWDSVNQIRIDGVYARLARPSLFRLMNRAFKFQETPWGGNFHCSSIPQELLHRAQPTCVGADLLHYGYMDHQDRLRKYEWYNRIDPNNTGEDSYRHMVIGDLFPADSVFRWAGPLELKPLRIEACR
jgi:glycosyltransferase involved in cell wall biosynthesis